MKTSRLLFIVLLAGCTPGASGGSGNAAGLGVVGGVQQPAAQIESIDINLTLHTASATQAGMGGGYAPAVLTVPTGASIRFVNSDGFAHTATEIVGASAFPDTYPFTSAALSQGGAVLSRAWSTGALNAGAASQVLIADKPGVYVFGCFFHYGAPMRGVIVVQ